MDARPVSDDRVRQLVRWCGSRFGGGTAVSGVRRLPGHGGETLTFEVHDNTSQAFVIRIAPEGVAARNNTDVLRQAPLLRALAGTRVPVAELVDAVDDESWFGSAALVQRRLPGLPLSLFPPTAAQQVRPTRDYLKQAVPALAALHDLEAGQILPGWETPRSPLQIVDDWARLVAKQPEPEWAEDAESLAEVLRKTAPEDAPIGLCHGDFQTNNVLYDESGALTGIVDWELAHVGPTPLDVMWLDMMADRSAWGEPHRSSLLVTAEPGAVVGWYLDAGGRLPDPEWYRALACFRYAVICGYNVRLHRNGRRVDRFNGLLAGTVPVLIARGFAALGTT